VGGGGGTGRYTNRMKLVVSLHSNPQSTSWMTSRQKRKIVTRKMNPGKEFRLTYTHGPRRRASPNAHLACSCDRIKAEYLGMHDIRHADTQLGVPVWL
jgi:hypothetical protein